MSDVQKARTRLIRALQLFEQYERGTYGRRDAIHKHIPNAVEAVTRAVVAEMLREQDTDTRVLDWNAIKEPGK